MILSGSLQGSRFEQGAVGGWFNLHEEIPVAANRHYFSTNAALPYSLLCVLLFPWQNSTIRVVVHVALLWLQ
jgi:hypothetical protein